MVPPSTRTRRTRSELAGCLLALAQEMLRRAGRTRQNCANTMIRWKQIIEDRPDRGMASLLAEGLKLLTEELTPQEQADLRPEWDQAWGEYGAISARPLNMTAVEQAHRTRQRELRPRGRPPAEKRQRKVTKT